VDHAAAVSVVHHVAHDDEPVQVQELPQCQVPPPGVSDGGTFARVETIDRLLQSISLDQPHGVKKSPPGIAAQTVDRDHTGMLEPEATRIVLALTYCPRSLSGDSS
jgi:hypothetical protein